MLFWGPGEESQMQDVVEAMESKPVIIPLVSLTQMAALLERCRAAVTNCNGPMHLAEAVATPTLTIYGPTEPEVWNPGGPHHRYIQAAGVDCLGCNLNECPTQHECMRHLPAQRVWQELERMLGLPAPAGAQAPQGA
jgi:ADP-heptose:LPS heptosyltransferase